MGFTISDKVKYVGDTVKLKGRIGTVEDVLVTF